MATYQTFLPNYYGSLVKGQQQALLLDNLYFFVADGVTKDAQANNALKTIKDEQEVITQIIYGGKMNPPDLIAMIRRINWVSGKVFDRYDSRDPMLGGKDFYCITPLNRVYKCLDNNGGAPSTEQPSTLTPGPFKTADGYVWTYMYRLSDNQLNDYAVGDYIPMIVDPDVTASAVRGTITTIDVVDPGFYPHTHSGKIVAVLAANRIRIEDTASPTSSIYDDMGFYVDNGSYAQITNYTANTSGKFVELDRNITVSMGLNYEIAPYVKISGNGFGGTAHATMRGEYVDRIEILNRGSEFTTATAELIANPSFGSIAGELQVNLSPIKGHGGDPYQELYVDNVLFNAALDNFVIDEDFPINDITFCRVGMVRQLIDGANNTLYTDSTFNNTFTITTTPSVGEFAVGDKVTSIASPVEISGQLVFANSTVIIGTYNSPHLRFTQGESVINQEGVIGVVQNITQPNVRLIGSDIVALINTDTIKRDENSRESVQILIKVK